ncbi:hypothetical protein NX059_001800 [Plenodomus lindquistii]|nr:hypothetical protein NX059_001800 [Plenodomus lindquistii]
MPKVNKKLLAVSKYITITFEGSKHAVEIFKHQSQTETYHEIHKALPPVCHSFRITDASDKALRLNYENLKTTATILAHRTEHREQGSGSNSKNGVKAFRFFAKIMEVEDVEHILPQDLRPRMRPVGKELYAAIAHNDRDIVIMGTEEWPKMFLTTLYDLSKITTKKEGHKMAVGMLRRVVAKRQADREEQHRKVLEVMTGDIRKAIALRKSQLEELETESVGVPMIQKGPETAKGEIKTETDTAAHTFEVAFKSTPDLAEQ